MRFFAEILEVYSDLDENMIITRSEDTAALPLVQKEFTENYETVALYDLTPIETGSLTVPAFHVLAKTYAGGQVLLTSDAQTVKVLAAKKQSVSGSESGYYASVLGGSAEDGDIAEGSAALAEDNLSSMMKSAEIETSTPEEIAVSIKGFQCSRELEAGAGWRPPQKQLHCSH